MATRPSLSGVLLFEGILFLIFGACALAMPYVFTLSAELVLGVVLILAGIMQCVRVIRIGSEYGRFLPILSSALAVILGVLMLMNPVAGILALTVFVAAFFLVEGVAKIALSIQMRPAANWGWVLTSGICSLILTALVMAGWPWSAAWFIGILIGVNLLIQGASLTALSFGVKRGELY